ncbi:hypothetical protein CQ10_09650 [Bradyrhizobium valentinum]|nr:hypothetical protein CQ10_09650 [Bradyrhizobium valentinum]
MWAILLILAATLSVLFGRSGAGVAQSSDSTQRTEASDDGPPPGGCNPIGVTASGEIVFPMTCKDFIEKHKATDRDAGAAKTKPATGDASITAAAAEAGKAPAAVDAGKAPTAADPSKPDEKDARPAAAQASADEAARPATNQAAVAPAEISNFATEPATTAAVPKRARNRVAGSPGCMKFRTYDAASGTYRSYSGHRRPCP